jgi:hypothetical protein
MASLKSELRHRYLNALRVHYRSYFEEGLCMPEAFKRLDEYAASALDCTYKEMTHFKEMT